MAYDTPGIHYEYEGRNGSYFVDLYNFKRFLRTVDKFKTKKQALLVAGALNAAYRGGLIEGAMDSEYGGGIEAPKDAENEVNRDWL